MSVCCCVAEAVHVFIERGRQGIPMMHSEQRVGPVVEQQADHLIVALDTEKKSLSDSFR